MRDKISFEEKQRFTQWWMWIFILLPLVIALYGCYQQLGLGIPMGNKPMTDTGLIFFTFFGLGFAYFFWINQLTTTLNNEGIKVKFFPYTQRKIVWEEVEEYQLIAYDFVGGWGIRLFTKYGTVYNVKGGKGLYIKLKNKKRFLVGTQRPEELEQFMLGLNPLAQVITE